MEDKIEVETISTEATRSTVKNLLDTDFTARYGGRKVTVPAGKKVAMDTAVAKVVGRHLVTRCIEEIAGVGMTPLEKSLLIQDKRLREEYGEKVFGGKVDEWGNPPFQTMEQQIDEQVKTTVIEDETSEPVENWSWKTLKAKAEELGIFNKEAKRPTVEKAVKDALETK